MKLDMAGLYRISVWVGSMLNELPNLPLILNLFLHAGYHRTVPIGKFSNLVLSNTVVFVQLNPFWLRTQSGKSILQNLIIK